MGRTPLLTPKERQQPPQTQAGVQSLEKEKLRKLKQPIKTQQVKIGQIEYIGILEKNNYV